MSMVKGRGSFIWRVTGSWTRIYSVYPIYNLPSVSTHSFSAVCLQVSPLSHPPICRGPYHTVTWSKESRILSCWMIYAFLPHKVFYHFCPQVPELPPYLWVTPIQQTFELAFAFECLFSNFHNIRFQWKQNYIKTLDPKLLKHIQYHEYYYQHQATSGHYNCSRPILKSI